MKEKMKHRNKPTLHDCVYMVMAQGNWWTPHELRLCILNKFKKSCSESGLTASMRDFRKPEYREKYKLPLGEVLEKKRNYNNSSGWKYKLIIKKEV